MPKPFSIFVSLLAYIFTIIVIIFLYPYFNSFPVLGRIAMLDLLATVVIFVFSVVFNNSSMYDPFWSVKPVVIALFYIWNIPLEELSLVQVLTLIGVILYGIRLTVNFYYGWPGMDHEDWRYRNFRAQFPGYYWLVSFWGIHFFPTVMVYLGCLPMYEIFQVDALHNWFAYPGILILYGSVLLAFVADLQLHRFRKNPSNRGKTINAGLWSLSRHPNYLGEILTWWGLLFIALSNGLEYWWIASGAIIITIMFIFISIPLIEKHALKRRNDYPEYRKKVPVLIPWLKF